MEKKTKEDYENIMSTLETPEDKLLYFFKYEYILQPACDDIVKLKKESGLGWHQLRKVFNPKWREERIAYRKRKKKRKKAI